MGLFSTIKSWFGSSPKAPSEPVQAPASASEETGSPRTSPQRPPTSSSSRQASEPPPVRPHKPTKADEKLLERMHKLSNRVGNLDREENLMATLEGRARDLMKRLEERIEQGDFEIPRLPPTSLLALEMANRNSVEIKQLVETIERDPLLTSEMLRIANSALYSAANPAATLQQAILRLGLRSVRGVVFSAAMKSSILNGRGLNDYSEEVWRQAQSVARIGRAIAPPLGFDPEQGHMIGLLHDIGKVALLGLLQRELSGPGDATPAIVGRAFHKYHERAGEVMAREWKLPDEIATIAGKHHEFSANEVEPRGAALAFLAHQLDLRLSLDDDNGLRDVLHSPAFEVLGAPEAVRYDVIDRARRAWINEEEAVEASPKAA
jgi:putative nucleotidyltransferase with HDIG domain